eukprot:gene10930-13387_t
MKLRVLVEPTVSLNDNSNNLETYSEEESHLLGKVVDFVITLGGDGTLGFLMPFNVEDYQESISNVIKGEFLCTNRMRLLVDVYNHHHHHHHHNQQQQQQQQQQQKQQQYKTYQVLNEVTLHRGSNPHSTTINCTINGHMLADIIGDGLIVATATGSTAYSLSCGGPMVHPCINCILITPIAPSSLSSKPSLLPDDSVLKLNISKKGRSTFSITLDGTRSVKMDHGDYIIIRKSPHPLLTINKTNETTDWVHGNGKLIEMSEKSSNWNQSIHTTSAN